MNKFESVNEQFRKNNGEVMLPLRKTKTSAGYDFYATQNLTIRPQEKAKFWSDVKVRLDTDKWLLCVVRSSKGIKDDLILCNTIGVIDSDYYDNKDNDGNMMFCIKNTKPSIALKGYNHCTDNYGNMIDVPIIKDLTAGNTVHINKGERVIQGIIVSYDTSTNCNSDDIRASGFGSTGK